MSRIQLRRDPFATWATNNPVLGVGEPGYETDTTKLRIGDGVTAWLSLPYFASGAPFSLNKAEVVATGLAAADIGADTSGAATAAVATEATARSTADALLIPLTQKGAASGIAPLDSGQHLPLANVPPAVGIATALANLSLGTVPNLGCDGDSLMVTDIGAGGVSANTPVYGLQTPHLVVSGMDARTTFVNAALGGHTIVQQNTLAPTALDPSIVAGAANICVFRCGTNDIYFGATAAQTLTNLQTYLTARLAAGWTYGVVCTLTPRSDSGTPGGFETARQAYNTALRAYFTNGLSTTLCPGMLVSLADIGADLNIGQVNQEQSTVYYNGSLVHHSISGYEISAAYIKSALQRFGLRCHATAPQYSGLDATHQNWNVRGIYARRPWQKFVPASDLSPYSSIAPTRVALNPTVNLDVWELDHSVISGLVCYPEIPTSWTQFSVDVLFINNVNPGDGGNVDLQGFYQPLVEGNNLYSGSTTAAAVTAGIGTYALLQAATIISQQAPTTSAVAMKIGVLRNGSNGADTSVNPLYVLGLLLRQDP